MNKSPEQPAEIRILRKTDDRSTFCSGNIELDRYFQRFAGQNQFRHHIGTNYIAVINQDIAGFITLSSGAITAEKIATSLKKRLPEYPLPILRISRLAVDQQYQGQGLGRQLLRTAFKLALNMRDSYGCIGIVVDAKAEAVGFYQSLGFLPLDMVSGQLKDRPEPIVLFLPLSHIVQSIEKPSL